MQKLWPILLTLLLIVPVSAQDSEIPYLYYLGRYGDGAAFIVERADGSDPHVIPVGEFRASFIDSTQWSPSGQWLAFSMKNTRKGDQYTFTSQRLPAVVNVDGTRRVTVMDRFASAVLSWSPTEDLLFVLGLPATEALDDYASSAIYQLALVDPAQDRILSSVQIQLTLDPNSQGILSYYRMHWSADGRYLMFHYQDVDQAQTDYPAIFQIFDTKAATVTTISDLSPLYSPFAPGQALAILPDDIAVFEHDGALRLFGIPGKWPDEQIDLPSPIRAMSPNPSESMALALLEDNSLWWLDLRDFQISFQKIVDNVQVNDSTSAFSGDSHRDFWSPDGQSAVFTGPDGGLYRLTVADGSTALLLDSVSQWRWRQDGRLEIVRTGGNERTYVLADIAGDILAETDAQTGRNGFSSSGRYVGAVDSSPFVRSVRSGDNVRVSRNGYAAPQSDYSGWLEWHPTQDWALLHEVSFVPMMGADPILYAVASADGTVRRDITACREFCVDWLPGHVDVTKIPQADTVLLGPRPTQVYNVGDYVHYLVWSPDSQSLLMGLGRYEPQTYQLLNPDTGSTEAVESPESCGFCRVEWAQNHPALKHPIFPEDESYGAWETSLGPDGLEASVSVQDLSFTPAVKLRDTTSETPVDRALAPAWAVAFSPDGQYLAVSSGWEVRLYRVQEIAEWLGS